MLLDSNDQSFLVFYSDRIFHRVSLSMGLLLLTLFLGCGFGATGFSNPQAAHLQGIVHGGQQPVSGSLIQLYAAGTTGNGSTATPLISKTVLTDNSGRFDVTGLYTCPTSDPIVYLTARGGNPGFADGTNNSSIAMISVLGYCSGLATLASVAINEVTTIGSLSPLAPYTTGSGQIGFASLTSYDAVETEIGSLVNIGTGRSPGLLLGPLDVAPVAKIYTLADVIAACINSSGGTAGDTSACGQLFSYTTVGAATAPTDTIAAIVALAQHPTQNASNLYNLSAPQSPFQPMLPAPPTDWTLPILSLPPAPVFSPGSGSYTIGQVVSIADITPGASLYYTMDGSTPTVNSVLYSAPFPLTQSMALKAVAVANGLSSAQGSAAYTVPVGVKVSPTIVALMPLQTQLFSAAVSGTANTAVNWSLSPSVGSISPTGLYTAPASITSAQTVMVTAISAIDTTKSSTASVTLSPAVSAHTTYFLSPTGNDSSNGLSSSAAWLSPNHALNCGDVIMASASSAYSASNFANGKWGTVTCASGNAVAWLKCVTFDACKIRVTSGTLDGMRVSASYWGVQGWEVNDTAGGAGGGNCFSAVPPNTATNIHHIIFANDVANVCPLGGLDSGNNGNAGVDYIAVVGNIAYGAGQTNTWCGSGISVYEPVASDSLPGTHVYVGGNFSYGSTNPVGCYDGNGIIFDTFDGDQTPLPHTYTQQGVIDNNIALANGGVGVRIEYNDAGNGANHSQIIARHNTMWGNGNGAYQFGNSSCGELQLYKTVTTEAYFNLAATNQAGCYGASWNPAYAYSASYIDSTSSVYQNFGWSAAAYYSGVTNSPGFAFSANNVFGSNPVFSNALTPEAPNCSSATSVPNCMATVIAHFTPTAGAAVGYGYQTPGSVPTYDSLFPRWLCNVNLPAGLVTMGCLGQ